MCGPSGGRGPHTPAITLECNELGSNHPSHYHIRARILLHITANEIINIFGCGIQFNYPHQKKDLGKLTTTS
jgi:hypothetical protein